VDSEVKKMKQYHRILVATDNSEQCRCVLDRVREFQQEDDVQLSLLQVLEHMPATVASDVVPPEGMDKAAWVELTARDHLRQLAEQNQLVDAQVFVVAGSAEEEIVKVARQQRADLIVMGTHARHGIERLRHSTTDSIVRHAPCDVLTVHTVCDVDVGGEYSALG
jgi:universal stress protein A